MAGRYIIALLLETKLSIFHVRWKEKCRPFTAGTFACVSWRRKILRLNHYSIPLLPFSWYPHTVRIP